MLTREVYIGIRTPLGTHDQAPDTKESGSDTGRVGFCAQMICSQLIKPKVQAASSSGFVLPAGSFQGQSDSQG